MAGARLGVKQLTWLLILSALTLLPGLGSSSRLTYHEAFVAQGAREILASGNWGYPTIGGLPWLEKPPLPWWLVAGLGHWVGGVNESVARFPSVLAAVGLVLGVAILGARHYGSEIGLLAGIIQATTIWTVLRGRMAEADILLACLTSWALIAFDRLLLNTVTEVAGRSCVGEKCWRLWRWAFFLLLGATALVKGIGFGAVLILSVVPIVLVWQRDLVSRRRLLLPAGWILAAILATAWPLFMIMRHGFGALALWTMHISDRLLPRAGSGAFAGEPWGEYILGLLGQALPWTPLALVGGWQSLVRASLRTESPGCGLRTATPAVVIAGDRLLCVWAIVPLGLLALAPVRNAHYAIAAQVPWSIWAALALASFGQRLWFQGYDRAALRRIGRRGLTGLAMTYGLAFWLFGPWFDRRGVEWAFYETAGRQLPAGMPVTFFYDDWDRNPYESPFGLIPHDLAVRLFYLGHSACWHMGSGSLLAHDHFEGRSLSVASHLADTQSSIGPGNRPLAVIGRMRDIPVLKQLGHIEVMAKGPTVRRDRTYALFQVGPLAPAVQSVSGGQTRAKY
jgi:hypothetical protein